MSPLLLVGRLLWWFVALLSRPTVGLAVTPA